MAVNPSSVTGQIPNYQQPSRPSQVPIPRANPSAGIPSGSPTDANTQFLTNYLSHPYNPNQSTEDLLKLYEAVNASGQNQIGTYTRNLYGNVDKLQQGAYDEMKSTLGRAPTVSEYNQLIQAFQGPNGLVNGRAAVSQYNDNLQKDPNNPNSSLNPNNPGYQNRISQYSDAITQQFQQILGRAPTQAELDHYASQEAGGQIDPYGIESALKLQPEYQTQQDTNFRNSVNDQLTGYDTSEFNREQGDVMAGYAARGFTPGNSPSLDYALTDLMGQIAKNRQAYLTQLSAQQYSGNKDLAVGNYQNTLDQMYQNNLNNRSNQQNLSNYYLQRGNQGADYLTQMNDYLKFANSNRSRSINPLYGAIGGIAGAGIGSYLAPAGGGAAGASAGYSIGNGLGNAFNYLNG